MPPPPILDLATLDCERPAYTREEVYRVLPQRYEFSQLDGILYADVAAGRIAGYRDIRPDEWWCRGHMPGRPIFPGILMLETGAQLAAFGAHLLLPTPDGFMGFGGIDRAKFRDSVEPPSRLLLLGRVIEARSRRFVFDIQAYVKETIVFEGAITGIKIKHATAHEPASPSAT